MAPSPSGSTPARSGPKVMLVCSSGGHLLLMHQLKPWWEKYERMWVTFPMADSRSLLRGERVAWAHHPTTRNVKNLLRNAALAWRLVRRARPSLVVSTGAGVALPFFLVARVLRIPTVYVEALERIDTASLTGRLCYPFSDLFVLQWDEQRRFFPRGQVVGALY
jgi:UDP-N-acetylglucosamine:LPS N-acetylglucosamine transferase